VPAAATAFAMGIAAERCAEEAARMRARFPGVYAATKGKPWRRLAATLDRRDTP
jgi:hypothetical protein